MVSEKAEVSPASPDENQSVDTPPTEKLIQDKSKLRAVARAIREINAAIKVDPKDWSAFVDRSYCNASIGLLKKAMSDANESIRLAPGESETFAARSYVWTSLDKHEKALEDINRAIKLEVDYGGYYTERGYALECLGRFEEAIADYRHAIELDDSDVLAWNNYASVLSMAPVAELRDGKTAVKAASSAVKLADSAMMRAVTLDTLGSAWAEVGNFKKALKASQVALKHADEELKAEIRERMELYKADKPSRIPTGNSQSNTGGIIRQTNAATVKGKPVSDCPDDSPTL